MNRLKLIFDSLLQRQVGEGEDVNDAADRMMREIRGTLYLMLTVFLLVAFTSYLPTDWNLWLRNDWENIQNLGGLVGAFIAHWILNSVGAPGYMMILLPTWLAIQAYRGYGLADSFFKIIGISVGTLLLSLTSFVLLVDKVEASSLWLGGQTGYHGGSRLLLYFHSTGSLLLLSFGFIIVFILCGGFSMTRAFQSWWNSEGEEFDEGIWEEDTALTENTRTAPAAGVVSKTKKSKKARGNKAKSTEKGAPGSLEIVPLPVSDVYGEAPDQFTFEKLPAYTSAYNMPSLRLLKHAEGNPSKLSRGQLKERANAICDQLESFQITGEITHISQGPVLITYEYKPSAGIKLSKIAALQDDLGIALGTRELKIIAPIPGKTVVGIEVPRPQVETIALKDVLGEKTFYDKKLKLPVALGKRTDGTPVFADLAAMPHLLVAGGTGSGKSVFVNSLIMSFLFRLSPKELRMILIDPKMLELSVFDGIPHLLTPVITDNKLAYNALHWAVLEMERRYQLMAQTNSKNIESFNSKTKSAAEKLPLIVIVVDELADLMMSGGQAVEIAITRLAQKARAAGIHLVIATQRPSTDVVTGLIKANMPSRLAFKVPSGIDSRTVLDTSGAEALLGKGDSLMVRPGVPLERLHGTFVTEDELVRVVKYVKGGKTHHRNYIDIRGELLVETKKPGRAAAAAASSNTNDDPDTDE